MYLASKSIEITRPVICPPLHNIPYQGFDGEHHVSMKQSGQGLYFLGYLGPHQPGRVMASSQGCRSQTILLSNSAGLVGRWVAKRLPCRSCHSSLTRRHSSSSGSSGSMLVSLLNAAVANDSTQQSNRKLRGTMPPNGDTIFPLLSISTYCRTHMLRSQGSFFGGPPILLLLSPIWSLSLNLLIFL